MQSSLTASVLRVGGQRYRSDLRHRFRTVIVFRVITIVRHVAAGAFVNSDAVATAQARTARLITFLKVDVELTKIHLSGFSLILRFCNI